MTSHTRSARHVLLALMIVAPTATLAQSSPTPTCAGSCAMELATKPHLVEAYVKKATSALLKCAKRGDPECPAACPLPDPAALGLSAGCSGLLRCALGNLVGASLGVAWDRQSACALQPAAKCDQHALRTSAKAFGQTLTAIRKGAEYKIAGIGAKCVTTIGKPRPCAGASEPGASRCAAAASAAFHVAETRFGTCDLSGSSAADVAAATRRARTGLEARGLRVDADIWGNETLLFALMSRTLGELGCSAGGSRSRLAAGTTSFGASSADDVRYCGPGSCSGWDCWLPAVEGTCLNEVCRQHDACYGALQADQCLDLSCYWSSQTEGCDDAFDAGAQQCRASDDCDAQCTVIVAIADELQAVNDQAEAAGNACPRGDPGECPSCPGSCSENCTCAVTTTTVSTSTTTTSTLPPPTCSVPGGVSGLGADAADVGVGRGFACSVIAGGVRCWGNNGAGQLGNGTTIPSDVPTDVQNLGAAVTRVVTGGIHACALTTAGTVKCWGGNNTGQLGNGSFASSSTPVDVCADASCTVPLSGIADIAAGNGHTCALRSSGQVTCWGRNGSGQLGDGTGTNRTVPSANVAGFTNAVAVVAGRSHTCALHSTGGPGGVTCWGANLFGQIGAGHDPCANPSCAPGDANCRNARCAPRAVCLDPSCSDHLRDAVVGLTAGDDHTCAVTVDGGVKCWGRNDKGQLGNGFACGVCDDGSACGTNGDCPDGGCDRSYCPTAFDALAAPGGPALTGVGAVAAGIAHTCALGQSGASACWGDDSNGQLGDGGQCGTVCATPVLVTGSGNGSSIAAGGRHTCMLTTDGVVRCWGGTGDCMDLNTLLVRYAPLLKYDSAEELFAMSAASMTDQPDNVLVDGNGTTIADHDPDTAAPLLNLGILGTMAATSADQRIRACDTFDPLCTAEASQFQASPLYRDMVYGRVLDKRAENGGLWLQYWAFYYFNPGCAGLFKHEGDWEGMQVRLDDGLSPVGVLFFQHGDGAWCTWDDQVERVGTAPVGYVAHNSHASYARAGGFFDFFPDSWCPGGDNADGAGRQLVPRVQPFTPATTPWLGWKGEWGTDGGPTGPAQKGDAWDNPARFVDELSPGKKNCNS